MNRLKYLLAALVVAVVTLGIYSCTKDSNVVDEKKSEIVETRNGIGVSCRPNIKLGLDCQDGSIPNPIQLSQYPGCNFYINATYIRCSDWASGTEYIHFGDFSIIEHDCAQYNIDLANAMSSGNMETFAAQFNANVWLQLTSYLLSQNSGVVTNTQVEYVVASCVRTCIVEKRIGDSKFTALIPVNTKCGDDCCRRLSTYRKINGTWTLTDQSMTAGGLCTPSANNNCPPNTIDYTDCIKNCTQFIYF